MQSLLNIGRQAQARSNEFNLSSGVGCLTFEVIAIAKTLDSFQRARI